MPPLHNAHVFCSGREQSTYCKHSLMATIKLYACHAVKIDKYTPPQENNSNRGVRARRAGGGSAFDISYLMGNE